MKLATCGHWCAWLVLMGLTVSGCGDPNGGQPAAAPSGAAATETESTDSGPADASTTSEPTEATQPATADPAASTQVAETPAADLNQPPVEDAIRTVVDGIIAQHPEVLWDALPKQYQDQASRFVRTFGRNMDAEVHAKLFELLRKTETILRDKKELILESPQLAEHGFDPAALSQNWEQFVGLLTTLLASDLADSESLKSIDIREFLATTGSQLMQQVAQLSASMPEDPYKREVTDRLSGLEVELISEDVNKAVVRLSVAGAEPSEVNFQLVGGKWLPEAVAREFSTAIFQVGMLVNSMLPTYIRNNKPLVLERLNDIGTSLDALGAAQDRASFDSAFAEVSTRVLAAWSLVDDPQKIARGISSPKPATSEPAQFVTVIIEQELEDAPQKQLAEQLLGLIYDADQSLVEPTRETGRTLFKVSPVSDVEAFSKRLEFASVTAVDTQGRTITITWVAQEPTPVEAEPESPPAEAAQPEGPEAGSEPPSNP